jgi:hypothetical protein
MDGYEAWNERLVEQIVEAMLKILGEEEKSRAKEGDEGST